MWLIVDTNATADFPNTITFSSTGGSTSQPALGPVPIPEPGTLTLGLVTLLLAGAFVLRKEKRKASQGA
jgi:hypothetical protein